MTRPSTQDSCTPSRQSRAPLRANIFFIVVRIRNERLSGGGAARARGELEIGTRGGMGEVMMAGDAGKSVRTSCQGVMVPRGGGRECQFVGIVCLEVFGSR
jgi:hypothetical protein